MREAEKGKREGTDIGGWGGGLFGPYVDAGRIYRAVCGQEIRRDRGMWIEESLQARCSVEIFRLLKG